MQALKAVAVAVAGGVLLGATMAAPASARQEAPRGAKYLRATTLHDAARANDILAAKILLAFDPEVDAKDERGRTPLHVAAWNNAFAVARLLIERGAEVDAKDERGRTPLSFAVGSNAVDVAKLLIERRANMKVLANMKALLCGHGAE